MIYVHKQKIGNASAIIRMLNKLAIKHSTDSVTLKSQNISGIILPGNGSFDGFMAELNAKPELVDNMQKLVHHDNIPVLGICVGMQALFDGSEEGTLAGLGFFKGQIEAFPENSTSPNLGWRSVRGVGDLKLEALAKGKYYFSHSYALRYNSLNQNFDELFISDNLVPFVAAFRKKNIFGAQFHPEKSSLNGLRFLSKFVDACANG